MFINCVVKKRPCCEWKFPKFRSSDHCGLKNLHHIWVIFFVLTQKEVFFILWLIFLFFSKHKKLEQIKMQIYMFCANKKLSSKKRHDFFCLTFDIWVIDGRKMVKFELYRSIGHVIGPVLGQRVMWAWRSDTAAETLCILTLEFFCSGRE